MMNFQRQRKLFPRKPFSSPPFPIPGVKIDHGAKMVSIPSGNVNEATKDKLERYILVTQKVKVD